MHARLPGERHGVQCVSGGKAVAVKRRAGARDAHMPNERPLAQKTALQYSVDDDAQDTGQGHDDRGPHRARPVKNRQRENEDVPEDAIAEATQHLEGRTDDRPVGAAIQTPADTVIRRIYANKKAAE
jgi:hypothetical protein